MVSTIGGISAKGSDRPLLFSFTVPASIARNSLGSGGNIDQNHVGFIRVTPSVRDRHQNLVAG